jgi:hypothetical protein
MGLPNVVCGRSHLGWASAAQAGACTVFWSDCSCATMLQATRAACCVLDLAGASAFVSGAPAQAAGPADRDRLLPRPTSVPGDSSGRRAPRRMRPEGPLEGPGALLLDWRVWRSGALGVAWQAPAPSSSGPSDEDPAAGRGNHEVGRGCFQHVGLSGGSSICASTFEPSSLLDKGHDRIFDRNFRAGRLPPGGWIPHGWKSSAARDQAKSFYEVRKWH